MSPAPMSWVQRFTHNVLGWHRPGCARRFDGMTVHARCVLCGSEIGQDSQGNWFAMPPGDQPVPPDPLRVVKP